MGRDAKGGGAIRGDWEKSYGAGEERER